MTQERFIKLLDNPALLSTISYEELKTLTLAYPYAHNLRTLLALKAQQIEHPEATRTLAAAAAYGLDRSRLFMLAAPKILAPQRLQAIKEEVLELRPIETVQRELEALMPVSRENRTTDISASLAVLPPIESGTDTAENPVLAPVEDVVTTEEMPPVPVVPQSFDTWIGQFQPPGLDPKPRRPVATAPIEPVPKQESAAKAGIAHVLAERSVAENKDVLSETLARLYAQQGHREKAINMYSRLSLAFPDKSAYFAAEIEKLKN